MQLPKLLESAMTVLDYLPWIFPSKRKMRNTEGSISNQKSNNSVIQKVQQDAISQKFSKKVWNFLIAKSFITE